MFENENLSDHEKLEIIEKILWYDELSWWGKLLVFFHIKNFDD